MDIIDSVTRLPLHDKTDNIKVLQRVGVAILLSVVEWEDEKISRRISIETLERILQTGNAALKRLKNETLDNG